MPGGGEPESTTTESTGWAPAMQGMEANLLPGVNQYAQQYGGGEGLWDQSRLADLDPNTTQGQESMLGLVPGMQEQYSGLQGSLEGFLDYDPDSQANMARRSAMTDNVSSMFNESIRPGIENRGTFSGQFGGPQQSIAMGSATAPLSRALADSEVSMMEGDRNRAMQAMSMAPGIINSQMNPGMFQENIGNTRGQRGQYELNDQVGQFEADRNNQLRSLQEQMSLYAPMTAFGSTTNGSTTTESSASPLQSLAGMAAIGADMYSGGGLGALGSIFKPKDPYDPDEFGSGGAYDGSW
jgi:hypothetical protein